MDAEAYPLISRLLHSIALGSKVVATGMHDMEVHMFGRNLPPPPSEGHIFVCGLARAGTTILMRQLHDTGDFASLTYRDMPFVLAPNFWQSMTAGSAKKREALERAHGDGVLVDFDSPEALEEVFWRVFCGHQYLQHDKLRPMSADADALMQFRRYVALILRSYGSERYLSKNNNNILRMQSIADAFPSAHILLPFRDPARHAQSLLTQHIHFCQMHERAPFSRRYMGWLAHHEFGSDHRPFRFTETDETPGATTSIDYWMERWIEAHEYLLAHRPANSLLMCYEQLCSDGGRTWDTLQDVVGIQQRQATHGWRAIPPTTESIPAASPALLRSAQRLYSELTQQSLKPAGNGS